MSRLGGKPGALADVAVGVAHLHIARLVRAAKRERLAGLGEVYKTGSG